MNNILMLIDTPPLTEFMDNPFQAISSVLTGPFGVFGYIFVMFALMAIVYYHTKNAFMVGVFIVLYGVVADLLYPATFIIAINFIGIGFIFGSVLYNGLFRDRL